jgi:hypothetical protein
VIPFASVADLPPDAEWTRLPDDVSQLGAQSLEVFDLTWTDDIALKWSIFVNPGTNRPQIAKYYEKLSADAEYELQSEYRFEYMSDDDMKAAIEKAFP